MCGPIPPILDNVYLEESRELTGNRVNGAAIRTFAAPWAAAMVITSAPPAWAAEPLEDVTASFGLGNSVGGKAFWGDYNNDGYPSRLPGSLHLSRRTRILHGPE